MEQKTVTINGTEYTLQMVMPREWLRMKDRSKNKHGQVVEENFYTEILKHIVVSPKVSLDDFTNMNELDEIVREAARFQTGSDEE